MKEVAMNLHEAKNAQLRYTAAVLESAAINGYSDDGYDDIQAALDVCHVLVTLDLETNPDDTTAFDQYVSTTNVDAVPDPLSLYSDHVLMIYYGTDGIAPEIHDAFLKEVDNELA